MQERHSNKEVYFNEQVYTTQKHVIPFVNKHIEVNKEMRVLEIGCGEAGNLKPFLDIGCKCVGIDLNEAKIEQGKIFFENHPNNHLLSLIYDDIYNRLNEFEEEFDLIILRDVIEHIHNQEKFMGGLKHFLKPNGKIYFGFPPWQNPFGGHQQICKSKFLSVAPYFHLLPKFMYAGILKLFGESKGTIENLLEVKETGISIERFERILRKENWITNEKILYFINPNYEVKFKLKPRVVFGFISKIPVLRNFMVTACYYLISKK